jgi:glycosyltransferase involved in cell wall biosynthesis
VPPARSGIADYSAELLLRMPGGFDITLVVAPGTTVDPVLSRFGTLTSNEAIVEHEREPFDLFVYHVGNSALHLFMLDLIRRYSGLTVLHDLSLTGLAIGAQLSGAWFGSLAASLEAESLFELAQAVRRGAATHHQISDAATLNGPVLARSDAVVVHSAWTRARVARATSSPVMHIPPGIPAGERQTQAEARRALGLPEDDFIVATLGEVTGAKRIASIVDALASLPIERRSTARLFIVGAAPPEFAGQLSEQAISRGLGDRVHFAGRRPLEELGRFACAADVCVQLRWPARGETSAALLRALAAGSACVISDAGSFAEIPADVALRVPAGEGEVEALARALERLRAETGLAAGLRRRAVAWVDARHSLDAAAEAFAAAILLTIARRQARDGEWADSVSAALDSAGGAAAADSLVGSWAELRAAAAGAGVTGARSARR